VLSVGVSAKICLIFLTSLHHRCQYDLSYATRFQKISIATLYLFFIIQRVTEISTLILTGNRTGQKEQLFYLPFCRKTMFNSKKKIGEIFH
jgi:hypothetical protein